jgi:hypothetical protein
MKVSLKILTLTFFTLSAPAFADVIFTSGPLDGVDNGLFVAGPTVQAISDGFVATNSGIAASLDFGEWVTAGSTPTTVTWSLGTTAFGTDISQGTDSSLSFTFAFNNGIGYDIFTTHVGGLSGSLTAGTTYYLTLSAGDDSLGDGLAAWDVPNGGSGSSATCSFSQGGTDFGDCGTGGETFTLNTADATTPEPGSVMLFGSGLLGLAGILRRRISR